MMGNDSWFTKVWVICQGLKSKGEPRPKCSEKAWRGYLDTEIKIAKEEEEINVSSKNTYTQWESILAATCLLKQDNWISLLVSATLTYVSGSNTTH